MRRARIRIVVLALAGGACGGGSSDAGTGGATTGDAAGSTGPAAPTTGGAAGTGTEADGGTGTGAGTGAGGTGGTTGGASDSSTSETTAGEATGEATATSMATTVDPACRNGQQDVDESDVDCGGSACPGCLEGQGCGGNLDCESAACVDGVCIAPDCTDKEQCTTDGCYLAACNAVTFMCSFVPVGEGEACDDGDACTLSLCMGGVCTIDEVICNGPAAQPGVRAGG